MPTANRISQNMLTRLDKSMLDQFYSAGFWDTPSIYDAAARHAARTSVAIRDGGATLSYGDLLDLADGLAADLRAAGLRAGDRVAAWLSSRVEVAVFLLACSRSGFIFCPSLHRNHTVDEIRDLLVRMRARAFVGEVGYGADADTCDIFSEVQRLPQVFRTYRLDAPGRRSARDIGKTLGLGGGSASVPAGQSDDIVYLAFTSGTTGEPKGVMHSNNTLLANARSLGEDWTFTEDSVVYTLSPLSHNLGFGALILTLLSGGQIVLHDLPRGSSLLARLRETGTTFVFGVPAHAMDLLDEIRRSGVANLDTLKGFRISGAAAPSSVVEALLSYGVIPQSGFGMTEAGSHHYTLPGDDSDHIINTSGRACASYEVQIFSLGDPDVQVPAGEVGQIGGRGASLMLGYFGDQRATESAFNSDGWFMTGDLGVLDEDGYLRITGRIKDIIIRGGHNIHPARIELLAMRHPQVERAAAIGIKDPRLGEKVCIAVMTRDRGRINAQDLLSHLHAQGLSKFDMPEYFLQVDEIPLGASGKILKRALLPFIADGSMKPEPVRWRG